VIALCWQEPSRPLHLWHRIRTRAPRGHSWQNWPELEKQIAAELIHGGPVLFLDNLNNTPFKSSLTGSCVCDETFASLVKGETGRQPPIINLSGIG
jgi:hypothetical protein